MSKKAKKQKKEELPAPQEFAAKHGIAVDTARAILDDARGIAVEPEPSPTALD